AMVLKLKGIEKKREEVQCQLGVENLTFKEIIQMLPEEEKNTSIELFNNLENATKRFNEINSSARVAIEINLHSIKKILDKLNGHKAKNDDGQGFTAMRV
ncbi:MAG: flagellar export chaperone FlgN, partial [Anaerotignaceae bacterium]